MSINKCRVCGNKLYLEPLLRFEKMPKSAQFLPGHSALAGDKGITLEICQCSGCGLVQLNNDPVSYYKEVIRAVGFSEAMQSFRERQFASFIKKYSLKGKKVIEIGCGQGEYLSILGKLGVDAYGLEYSEKAVRHCLRKGIKATKGFIGRSDCKLKQAPFSAFFILSFLEHLPDPNAALKGIYSNLTEEAVGLVEVPNFDMILRKNLFAEFISDHLFYFTKETLKTTLELNGFEIIECKEIWQDYIISAVVRPVKEKAPNVTNEVKKERRLDLDRFHQYRLRLQAQLEEYISRFKDKGVAIWGAGHQALTVIALANLTKKIRYVVDSAPFKQGRFTPATHIAIVSPEALVRDPVEAVIVMAASYSDEVARIIHDKFKDKIKVCVLRDFKLEDA